MFNDLIALLNQPYPDNDDNRVLIKNAFVGGLVIFCVLYFLRPFGMTRQSAPLELCLIFGLISIVVALSVDFTIKYVLKLNRESQSWTLWKWITVLIVLIILIALANYIYVLAFTKYDHTWMLFWNVIGNTFLIGIFPITLFGTTNLITKLKANQQIANEIQLHSATLINEQLIDIPILKSTKIFSVNPEHIRYIESMQNYVTVYYFSDGKVQKEVIRNTLSALEKLFIGTTIKKCHRSYLVNTNEVLKVSGNAQGLKLEMNDITDKEVPVSRKFVSIFR